MEPQDFPFEEGSVIDWRYTRTTIVKIKGWSHDGERVECVVSQLDALYFRHERDASIRPDDVWAVHS